MNSVNERQHYISKVLLERFKLPGKPLECYEVATGHWIQRSLEKACSAPGYNQLVLPEGVNNAIEDGFSKVESKLPKVLKALQQAADQDETVFPKDLYHLMCAYCAFLRQTSLFAKAGAVASFLIQINRELKLGENYLLRELAVPEDVIAQFREGYAQGGRLVIESENVLQLVYRLQFQRLFPGSLDRFTRSSWVVAHSPLDLPMPDIGLIEISLEIPKVIQYLLPMGPRLLLEGTFHLDLAKNSPAPVVNGHTLSHESAQYRFDLVCASAIKELIFSRQQPGIEASMARAKAGGIRFNRITNPEQVAAAGLREADTKYGLQMVPEKTYVDFLRSFVEAGSPAHGA